MKILCILLVSILALGPLPPQALGLEMVCDFFDPNKTSAPPKLGADTQIKPFGCKREFRYQGRIRLIDSYHRQDAEQIRPIISDVPEAVSELNLYQSNRRKVRTAAYFGTFGVVTALSGVIFARQISETNPASVRNIFVISGLLILAISTGYALNTLSDNETHVVEAVKIYNQKKTSDPIELQFSTSILSF